VARVELPALFVDDVRLVDDVQRPVLINRDPGPDERDVPLDTSIALELVDIGVAGIDRRATRVFVGDLVAFDGGAQPEIDPRFVGAGVSETADTLRIVLEPRAPFESQARAVVRVVTRTRDGHALDERYSFQVEDRTAPKLVAVHATSPHVVRVAFDEPVAASAAGFAFETKSAPAVPLAALDATVARDGVVTVILDQAMTPDAEYEVVAIDVRDSNGNAAVPPFDRARFVGFRPAQPPGRRLDLWSMLPKHNRRDDETGDLRRFIACLQEIVDLLLADLDAWPAIFDLERAPEAFVDAMLVDLGSPFAFELTLLERRKLAALLVDMYRQKGTAIGIRDAIRFFVGVDDVVILPFNADGLVLGVSELGVDWILGPSDRFARYAFVIEVGRVLTTRERRIVRAVVDLLRPAQTHFVELREPAEVLPIDDWELGRSLLDTGSLLH